MRWLGVHAGVASRNGDVEVADSGERGWEGWADERGALASISLP
jgi:hypothetical protein